MAASGFRYSATIDKTLFFDIGNNCRPLSSVRPEIGEIGFPGIEKKYYSNGSDHN
jgi:hypothetical protein